ncbi:50S ribosomal protein L35 [Candidatus Woesebacteria bacterium]|nr:50S ribosomal protein L35 [Candidatus Woesebacteria bacterium]
MGKMKTRKSLTRRFKITKNGKVLRRQGFKRHQNASKSRKKKRALSRIIEVDNAHAKKIRKILGKNKKTKVVKKEKKAKKQRNSSK